MKTLAKNQGMGMAKKMFMLASFVAKKTPFKYGPCWVAPFLLCMQYPVDGSEIRRT